MWKELLVLQAAPGKVLRVGIPDGRVHTLVEDAGPFPDGIVVESGTVYWTSMGTPAVDPAVPGEAGRDFSARDGGLHAVSPDGRSRPVPLPPGTIATGKQLTSDGAGMLYWADTDREGHRVSRVRTDGTGLTDLVITPADDGIMGECVGVAEDPARGHLYWTQKGPAKGGKGRILRAGLEIPPGQHPDNRSDVEVLWDGLPEPIDLHLADEWLYRTDRGAPPAGNTLNRAPVPPPGKRARHPRSSQTGSAKRSAWPSTARRASPTSPTSRAICAPCPCQTAPPPARRPAGSPPSAPWPA